MGHCPQELERATSCGGAPSVENGNFKLVAVDYINKRRHEVMKDYSINI